MVAVVKPEKTARMEYVVGGICHPEFASPIRPVAIQKATNQLRIPEPLEHSFRNHLNSHSEAT